MTSIIILIKSEYDYVVRCVKSIISNTNSPFEFIFVVYEGTSQKIIDYLNSITYEKQVIIIKDVIPGPTYGINSGLCAARGEYFLIFDDSSFVDNPPDPSTGLDWLTLMRVHYNDREVGVVYTLLDNDSEKADANYQGYCLMFIPRVLHTIGFLDPTYGELRHQESEYILRAKYNGFRVVNAGYVGVYSIEI